MHLSDGQQGAGGILGRGQCMDRIPGPALAQHMQGDTGSSGLQGQEGGWTGDWGQTFECLGYHKSLKGFKQFHNEL